MNIVVLAGGLSAERDVSFVTSGTVAEALRKNGHRVILLDVFMGYGDKEEDLDGIFELADEVSLKTGVISETAPDLAKVKALRKDQSSCFFGPNVIRMCQMADIVFIGLHGENGENGKVQAAFDLFGIRYTGSGYLSSAIAMNKNITKHFFRANGIPTPQSILVNRENCGAVGISLPCVVKPCCGGSSIGVTIAGSQNEFEAALEEGFRWEEELIIEEYIKGREFSVGVIQGKALPVIEIAPLEGFYDYKNKYKAGSAVETCPARLPDYTAWQMQSFAEKVSKVIGLDSYCRADFLLNEQGEIFCLEVNTLPGMTPISLLPQEAAAVGMDFGQLCEKLIAIAFEKYGGKQAGCK